MLQLDGYAELGSLACGYGSVAWYWYQDLSTLMTWIDSICYVIHARRLDPRDTWFVDHSFMVSMPRIT